MSIKSQISHTDSVVKANLHFTAKKAAAMTTTEKLNLINNFFLVLNS